MSGFCMLAGHTSRWQLEPSTMSLSHLLYRAARGRYFIFIPIHPRKIASIHTPIPITVHYSRSQSLSPTSNIAETCQRLKYSYATKHRKCDTLKSSKFQQMVQCRLTCHKAVGGNVECRPHSFLCFFCLQLHWLPRDYRRQPAPLPR